MAKLFLAFAFLSLLQAAGRAETPEEIAKKVTAAKDAYYAERDKADQALIELLTKKETTAKQAGDIKAIEAVRAESDAFRKEGKLPKLVPLTLYETAIKQAQTKLDNAFKQAIKAHTIADRLEDAKALQKQLETLLSSAPRREEDPFVVNSTWVRPGGEQKLLVLQRQGEKFSAKYSGPRVERIVTGTIKDQTIQWEGKDSKIIRGPADGDHTGKMSKDDKGWKIDFTWYRGGVKVGDFTQRLDE